MAMAFMPWSESFKTGLTRIDEQHRWLVDATNRLHDEITQSTPDRTMVTEVLEGLVDYAMNHFILEEELFQRYGYPQTMAHRAEHDAFSREATELLMRHEGGADVQLDTLDFLKEWLKHHILVVDMAYVPFLKERMKG
jgi:hemerythrin